MSRSPFGAAHCVHIDRLLGQRRGEVRNLHPDAAFYTLRVANREAPSYTREELDEQGWRIDLSIGD